MADLLPVLFSLQLLLLSRQFNLPWTLADGVHNHRRELLWPIRCQFCLLCSCYCYHVSSNITKLSPNTNLLLPYKFKSIVFGYLGVQIMIATEIFTFF
jgi:hypothetical protein